LKRVVITGQGTINSLGFNVSDTNLALMSGHTGIQKLDLNNSELLRVNIGAQIQNYDPHVFFKKNEISLLDHFSQYALISASEAINSSGLVITDELSEETGVIIGSAGGGLSTQEDNYRLVFEGKKNRVHPFIVPKMMHNAAASNIAKRYSLKGVTYSVSSACASSNHAIANAFNLIKYGEARVMIAGGSDAMLTFGGVKAWEGLRVLSKTGCRPFCLSRDGLVQGEGAAVFVLEEYTHAYKRGANILAEIKSCSMTSDGYDLVAPSADGMKKAIMKSLYNSGISADDVDYVNAHGTGTKINDQMESDVINFIFSNNRISPKVSSTKSAHGHVMGATGAIELLSCILALREHVIVPTLGLVKRDPKIRLDLVCGDAQQKRVETVISNSFAFGGLNSTIILQSV
jgi:nodulation protein E